MTTDDSSKETAFTDLQSALDANKTVILNYLS